MSALSVDSFSTSASAFSNATAQTRRELLAQAEFFEREGLHVPFLPNDKSSAQSQPRSAPAKKANAQWPPTPGGRYHLEQFQANGPDKTGRTLDYREAKAYPQISPSLLEVPFRKLSPPIPVSRTGKKWDKSYKPLVLPPYVSSNGQMVGPNGHVRLPALTKLDRANSSGANSALHLGGFSEDMLPPPGPAPVADPYPFLEPESSELLPPDNTFLSNGHRHRTSTPPLGELRQVIVDHGYKFFEGLSSKALWAKAKAIFFLQDASEKLENAQLTNEQKYLIALQRKAAMDLVAFGKIIPEMAKMDTEKLPVWMKCNLQTIAFDLYSEDGRAVRGDLISNAKVKAALARWWDAIQNSLIPGRSTLARESYIVLSCLVHKALVPDATDEEAVQCAEKDWEVDCQGQEEMSKVLCYQAVFHLADVWTEHPTADAYAEFLDTLLEGVTLNGTSMSQPFYSKLQYSRGPYMPPPAQVHNINPQRWLQPLEVVRCMAWKMAQHHAVRIQKVHPFDPVTPAAPPADQWQLDMPALQPDLGPGAGASGVEAYARAAMEEPSPPDLPAASAAPAPPAPAPPRRDGASSPSTTDQGSNADSPRKAQQYNLADPKHPPDPAGRRRGQNFQRGRGRHGQRKSPSKAAENTWKKTSTSIRETGMHGEVSQTDLDGQWTGWGNEFAEYIPQSDADLDLMNAQRSEGNVAAQHDDE